MSLMRPWQYLPIPMPNEYDPAEKEPLWFYNNIGKHLVEDFIKMMCNGLLIDDEKVETLRSVLDSNLNIVKHTLTNNALIKQFLEQEFKESKTNLIKEQQSKFRTIDYYLKPYKHSDMTYRTYLVNEILKMEGLSSDIRTKWTMNDLKKYNKINHLAIFDSIIDKSIDPNHQTVQTAMQKLAQEKLDIYNKSKMLKVDEANIETLVGEFNPGSSVQKYKLLTDMLGYESGKESKTYLDYRKQLSYGKTPTDKNGKPKREPNQWSWGRDQLEDLLKTLPEENNKDLIELLQALVDYSFSSIIRTNFIEAFDSFTIDNYLHGNIKLLGAVSGRNTSNAPNMLNMPSTKSKFAKPVKECFIAPEGYLVFQADFSALEEVCLANLSKDKNKLAIFQDGLDSHCFNSYGYYKDEIEAILPRNNNESTNDYIKRYKQEVDNIPELKAIRQRSKPVSFKLNYLGMPDIDKGGVITPEMYNRFWNELYKDVKVFLDEMIVNHKRNGYTHLGLGFRIYSSNIDKHFRTIWNAYAGQFWSILSLITVNEMHYRINEENLSDDIIFNSTIYDACYGYVKKDAKTVKWLNDNLIEVMTKDWLEKQPIKNQADMELGKSWKAEITIPNNASLKDIEQILKDL